MSSGLSVAPSPRRPAVREATALSRRTVIRLWLPLTALWIVLSPVPILVAPLLMLLPRRPFAGPSSAVFAIGAVLFALSGTIVEVEAPHALIRIRIV